MQSIYYIRVSSKEQVEGASLDVQQRVCESYSQSLKKKVFRAFKEEGESAKVADRSQLLALFDFCRAHKGQVDTLIVWKLDRLARNTSDHFAIKVKLAQYGVRVVSATEAIDDSPEGRLLEAILAGVAQFENELRAMRTSSCMQRRVEEGLNPWRAPVGYKSAAPGERKLRPDVPDQPRYDLIKRAWKEFASGAYTETEIRRMMTTWGVTARTGRPLSPQTVHRMFRNLFYAGVIVDPWSGKEYVGGHPPMVSREDFARVQTYLSRRRRRRSYSRQRAEFPLRGLVRCSGCRHQLSGGISRGRSQQYAYYLCFNRSCLQKGKSKATHEVHSEFETFMPKISPSPTMIDRIQQLLHISRDKECETARAIQEKTEIALKRLNREQGELISMRMKKLISDDEFDTQKDHLLQQKYSLQARIDISALQGDDLTEKLAEISEPLSDLLTTWKKLPHTIRRRFERIVLPGGYQIGSIRTAELGPLLRALWEFGRSDSHLVTLEITRSNQILNDIKAFWEVLQPKEGLEEVSKTAVRTKKLRGR